MKGRYLNLVLIVLAVSALVTACSSPATPAPAAPQPAAQAPAAAAAPTQAEAPTATAASPATSPTTVAVAAASQPVTTTVARPTRAPSRSVNKTIPAPSKAKNMVGEPAEGEITVYLPPSYHTSDRRYPVLYYLPGFGDGSMLGLRLPASIDELISAGKMQEMIIVVAPGQSVLGGSFYANSPVTGNWEDYIVKDVVAYVDGNFRTLADPKSRGITGHSMGGFGALNLAMRHPDVFSAVYSLSPGLFDDKGLAEFQPFATQAAVDAYVRESERLSNMSPEDAAKAFRAETGTTQLALAYGAAFSPDASANPPYVAYPVTMAGGKQVRDEKLWQAWAVKGYGGAKEKAATFKENLLRLKGIVVDCGTKDEYKWIPKGCAYHAEQMKAGGVPVELVTFEGDHEGLLAERITEHALPYFSKMLAGAQQ